MPEPLAIALLWSAALLMNIPLGFLRRRSRRWSVTWFIGCDGSVPVLMLLRRTILGVGGPAVILLELVLALVGNLYGPRLVQWWRNRSTTGFATPAAERV